MTAALAGRTVVVTGASSGIGAATARHCAALGARVILLARDAGRLRAVADRIGPEAEPHAVDLADPDALAAVAARIEADHGTPDVLVNNAGGGRWRFAEETDPAEARAMMDVPVLAAFHLTRCFLPGMLERGRGTIVTVTSMAAFTPFPGATAYVMSRKALLGLHEALAADLSGTGVRPVLAYFARVDSLFWANNPGSAERVPGAQALIPRIDPDRAGRAIARGVARGRRTVTAPGMARVVRALAALAPGITSALVRRTGHRRNNVGRTDARP